MKDWEINIKPNGVSIKTQNTRELIDPATGETVEIATGTHRTAIGVGDFETAELFTAHVSNLMDGKYGAMIAHVVSESEAARGEVDRVNVVLEKLEAQVVKLEDSNASKDATIESMVGETDLMVDELNTLRGQVEEVINANRNK